MKKYKNADKIMQLNELNNKPEATSHLVAYMKIMNEKGHIPRSMGMIHRKDDTI